MSDQLVVVDGPQTVAQAGPVGIIYRLAVRVEGVLTRSDPETLGPALNALYGAALAAVLADRTLGGLAIDVAEGGGDDEDAGGLEVDIARDPFAAAAGAFALHLGILHWQGGAAPSVRESVLDALTTVLAGHVPLLAVTVREQVLVALRAHIEAALGAPLVRNAVRPATPGSTVYLLDGDQVAYHDTVGQTLYSMRVAFEVFVPGPSAEGVLDALVQTILGALRTADRLGGAALDVEDGTVEPEVLREEYAGPCLAARVATRVWFVTAENDPTAVPT
jgi:hypothetical protein